MRARRRKPTGRGVILDDQGRNVAGESSDAAGLAHVGPRIGKVDGVDFKSAVRSDRLDLFAGVAPQRLVVLEPLHLMNAPTKKEGKRKKNNQF